MTNDHDAPDSALLASLYFDGQANDEERARAELDPQVMELVARFGSLRTALAAVEPPVAERRDAAIGAALEASDSDAGAAARSGAAPTSLADRPRRRWMASVVTGAAAAALVLVAVAGIVAVSGGGSDDDSADAPTAAEGGGAADATMQAEMAADTMAVANTDEGGDASERTMAATDAEAATNVAGTSAGATTDSGDEFVTGETARGSATSLATVAGVPAEALTVLRSGPELYAFATAPPVADDGETVVVTCDPPGDGVYVGRASYVRGETAIVVDVYLDDATAQAFDAITCELVVQAVP